MLILRAPRLDGLARLLQRREPVVAETPRSAVAVEAPDEGVLDRFAGQDYAEPEAVVVGPPWSIARPAGSGPFTGTLSARDSCSVTSRAST